MLTSLLWLVHRSSKRLLYDLLFAECRKWLVLLSKAVIYPKRCDDQVAWFVLPRGYSYIHRFTHPPRFQPSRSTYDEGARKTRTSSCDTRSTLCRNHASWAILRKYTSISFSSFHRPFILFCGPSCLCFSGLVSEPQRTRTGKSTQSSPKRRGCTRSSAGNCGRE